MLLDRDGEKADAWVEAEGAAIGNLDRPIVSFAALPDALAAREQGRALGVAVPNTVRAADLTEALPRLSLIAIAFPGFGDGRGFSIAKTLREAGFAGTLRARGPLIPDQFVYALACGFDEVEVTGAAEARQSADQWTSAASGRTAVYQRGYAEGASILDRRRAARAV